MSPIFDIQQRFRELGRIRTGEQVEKNGKKVASPLNCFRLTSASERLLQSAAEVYGGEVKPWDGPQNEGRFELYTASSELEVLLPVVYSERDGMPSLNVSQYYELYTAAGCQRRCDGITELLSGGDCQCEPGERTCKPTTRMGVMLPRIPEIGIWLLTSHGYNAAAELPATVKALLSAARGSGFVAAVLRIEQREEKHADERFPRRYVVPVIDTPGVKLEELVDVATGQPLAINPPAPRIRDRPALPTGNNDLPPDPAFENTAAAAPPMGESPSLPDLRVTAREANLLGLAEELGVRQKTEDLINRHADQHVDDPDKHLAWLTRQVKAAEKKLAEHEAQHVEGTTAEVEQSQFPIPAGAARQEGQG